MTIIVGSISRWMTSYPLFAIETLLVVFGTLSAVVFRRVSLVRFREIERQLNRLARRRALAVVFVGALALIGRASLLAVIPIPEAGSH